MTQVTGNKGGKPMQVGMDSFAAQGVSDEKGVAVTGAESVRNLVDRIVLADQAGLDVFGVGEHHRKEYLDSAPAVIWARRRRAHIIFGLLAR